MTLNFRLFSLFTLLVCMPSFFHNFLRFERWHLQEPQLSESTTCVFQQVFGAGLAFWRKAHRIVAFLEFYYLFQFEVHVFLALLYQSLHQPTFHPNQNLNVPFNFNNHP